MSDSESECGSILQTCGLCGCGDDMRKDGRTIMLMKTECCDNWICDDERSCSREHRRFTLCAFHFAEGQQGRWQDCKECRDQFDTSDYVEFGTGSANFEELEDPERFFDDPEKKNSISCVNCGFTSDAADALPLKTSKGYYCTKEECQKAGEDTEKRMSISCVNCGFSSDLKDTFPLKTSNGYYCTKEECQKEGVTHNK